MDRRDYAALLVSVPRRRDQVLPALHIVHAAQGWLPEDAIVAVSDLTAVPLSELYGIISSYSEFRLQPPLAPHIEVCTGLSCLMAGASALLDAASDGGTVVERTACQFLCGVAPVVSVCGNYHGRMDSLRFIEVTRTDGAHVDFDATIAPDQDDPEGAIKKRVAAVFVGAGECARSVGAGTIAAMLNGRVVTDRHYVTDAGCDGDCWAQPIVTVIDMDGDVRRYERVTPEQVDGIVAATIPTVRAPFAGQTRRLLRRSGITHAETMYDARELGAYRGWEQARAMSPEAVIARVKEAGLRGRGGAYFPMALKWESAREHPGPRYLVVNAEEGEPGVFKDRHLMEGDPHLLFEGILIAAHAAGCERALLYINGQAELSDVRMHFASNDAAEERVYEWRHPELPAGEQALRIEFYRGAGGYVCGEESVILNSIEGERAVPRPRPPLPTDAGLWGRPTVINNVETLCNLPFILTEGVEAFRSVGTEAFPGTKLVSLSGAVQRPGLYEVPMGITTREVIALGGGPPPGRTVCAVVMGGPSGGFLTPEHFDLPLVGGLLHPTGATLGAGGIVVLDDQTPLSLVLRHLAAYNARESCGKCTPCREGTERALAILDRAGTLGWLDAGDRADLEELCDLMQYASLCGLGQMAPGPIRSALALFAGDADAIPDAQGERRW